MTGASIDEQRTDVAGLGQLSSTRGQRTSLSGGTLDRERLPRINCGFGRRARLQREEHHALGRRRLLVRPITPTDAQRVPAASRARTSRPARSRRPRAGDRPPRRAIQTTLQYRRTASSPTPTSCVRRPAASPETDKRPDTRHQFSWLTRYRHHFEASAATLHADYQFNCDDWDMNAHTFELAWYQTLFGWSR